MSIRYLISKIIKKCQIPSIRDSNIDKTAKVCSASHLVSIEMGGYSYIGNYCTVINTRIGRFCSIADNCIIGGASHPIEWVSTSPVFQEGRNIMKTNFSTHPYQTMKETVIGNDVWIGSNCLIKGGIKIGDGAVIGMGSILTKDVGPYEIWAGNPARLISKRFSEETVEKLLESNWWEWGNDTLAERAHYFNDVEKFLSHKKESRI
ncbi:TPA: CatB-related O-acetyltransferase [Bacillus cereus]|nr:CatB-related O-acetyltransferase [Bacillus cereus]